MEFLGGCKPISQILGNNLIFYRKCFPGRSRFERYVNNINNLLHKELFYREFS